MTWRLPLPAPEVTAWFLDIDGTLVGFARSPHGIHIDRPLRRLIESLHRASGGALALISGRPIADLDRLFGHVRLPSAGQHGLERRSARGRLTARSAPVRLDLARRRLAAAVAGHRGLLLEDKGLSLALHYRGHPALAGFAHRLARAQLSLLGPGWCMQKGSRVVEIRPAGRDKGKAVRAFLREPPFRGRVPVFVGDDLTDENAFAVVNRAGGWSIKVGRGPTAAAWRLSGVEAVRGWLSRGRPAPRRIRGSPGRDMGR